jgi:hypothetical protein
VQRPFLSEFPSPNAAHVGRRHKGGSDDQNHERGFAAPEREAAHLAFQSSSKRRRPSRQHVTGTISRACTSHDDPHRACLPGSRLPIAPSPVRLSRRHERAQSARHSQGISPHRPEAAEGGLHRLRSWTIAERCFLRLQRLHMQIAWHNVPAEMKHALRRRDKGP